MKTSKITLNEFYRRSTAKNIKQMRGHDGPSQEWDIYFDNEKICNCWDDSYGGELQVINYDGKSIEDIFETIDKESTWDSDYKWYTNLEIILENVKSRTNFSKDEKKGVCVGFSHHSYDILGFKTNILTSLAKWPEVKEDYEKMINEHCSDKNGRVLNWKYLEGCHINVPKEYRYNRSEVYKMRYGK